VADADPAHLALVDQLGHRRPRLLDGRPGPVIRPVELVEVDALDAEPFQARLALLPDRSGSQVVVDLAAAPGAAALREDEDVLAGAEGLDRAADDLLGVAGRVRRSRVDPAHTRLDCAPDRRQRLVVVDRAPAEAVRPGERPGAEAEHRQLR